MQRTLTDKEREYIMGQYRNDPRKNYLNKMLSMIYKSATPSYVLVDGELKPKYSDHEERQIKWINTELENIHNYYQKKLNP